MSFSLSTRQDLSVIFVLLFLCSCSLMIPTRATGRLAVTIGFDNDHVFSDQPGERYLEVLVETGKPLDDRQQQRLPLNIALVVDVSESMAAENKILYVKQAATALLDRLKPGDRFSLITYNNQARVLIPSQGIDKLWQARNLINQIRPTGATNLYDGLRTGYNQLNRHCSYLTLNRVILFSDGMANRGITSAQRMGRLVQRMAARGISLSTFGVGLDFNEDLLASLSEDGRGMYYYVDQSSDIDTFLTQEFYKAGRTVATDIIVTVELPPGLLVSQVMANRYEQLGSSVMMYGGDLAAGERRRFQIRLQPDQGQHGLCKEVRVKVSYSPSGSKQQLMTTLTTRLYYDHDRHRISAYRHDGISERSAFFEAHYARARAAQAVDQGDLNKALQILSRADEKITPMAKFSPRLRQVQQEIRSYANALQGPLNRRQKAHIQKRVKYKTYLIEGC